MHDLLQDVKFGWRTLRRSPGFTTIALATLAIAIGANTAIFSFVDAVLLKPLPYDEPDRILHVLEKRPDGGKNGISTLNYLDWAQQNTVFECMAAQTGGSVTMTGVDDPRQLRGMRVTSRYFDVFGVRAVLGRTFVAGEDQVGHDQVVVLNHTFWQSQFAGDPAIIGRELQLDGRPYTVIGVLPKETALNRAWPQLWRPLAFAPENMTRDFHWFSALARLKPGMTIEQARAEMDAIGARIAQDFPDSNKGWGVAMDYLADVVVGKELRQSLHVLMAAVGMVLLIGCANLANLLLARGMTRDREVAIRAALGASRARLVRQFLTESLLLSIVGGVLGVGLGFAMMRGLKFLLPPYALPAEAHVTLDLRLLGFALGIAVVTGIVCGLIPALHAARPNLTTGMKQSGGGASAGRARVKLRATLVVVEVALAFVLLTGAGLLIRSLERLQDVDVGFDGERVLTAHLPVTKDRAPTPEALQVHLQQIEDVVAALPAVKHVAFTSALPLRGWGYGMPFQIADQPIVDRANRPGCFFKMVSPSYFSAVGLRLLSGRGLTTQDAQGAPPVAVISEAMRKKHLGEVDPIGKRILIQEIAFGKTELGPEIAWEVVGVVADEKVGGVGDPEGTPGIYVNIAQSSTMYLSLAVLTASDPGPLHKALRDAVRRIDPDQALPEMKTLAMIKTESLGGTRLRTVLLSVFASVALLLATSGLYGVISYSVAQRTRELGIRSALGASASDIRRLVVRHGMTMVLIGLGVGGVGVFAVTRLLSAMLFGVGSRDPLTMIVVAGALASVALLACLVPARRAGKVDPIITLRAE